MVFLLALLSASGALASSRTGGTKRRCLLSVTVTKPPGLQPASAVAIAGAKPRVELEHLGNNAGLSVLPSDGSKPVTEPVEPELLGRGSKKAIALHDALKIEAETQDHAGFRLLLSAIDLPMPGDLFGQVRVVGRFGNMLAGSRWNASLELLLRPAHGIVGPDVSTAVALWERTGILADSHGELAGLIGSEPLPMDPELGEHWTNSEMTFEAGRNRYTGRVRIVLPLALNQPVAFESGDLELLFGSSESETP